MYLFVYCAGGFGKEVMDIARRAQARWQGIAFLDDGCEERTTYSSEVFGLADALERFGAGGMEVVIANGEPVVRRRIREKLEASGIRLATLVDPSAVVSPTAKLAPGVVVFPGCFVSSDAVLGTNSVMIAGAMLGHDAVVGEDCMLSGQVNIGGACTIGPESYVGMGAQVKQQTHIGRASIIGMGSVVFNDIPDEVIALGNPCRPMRPNDAKKVFGQK